MSESEKLVQVVLNIGVDGYLSQAEADALLRELENQVHEQTAGSVEVMNKQSPEESQSKGEPMMTLAIVVIQYVVPKLIDIVFDMIKERRNSQVRAFAKVGGEQITLDSRTDVTELHEIQERVQVAHNSDEAPERRFALLVGTTSYQDTRLNQLASPEVDVQALADVLRDPSIGGYDDVNLLLNQSSLAISQAVEQFFKRKATNDLLLLYFSGHGVRDEDEELYLAVQNTDLELLRATAVSSSFIKVLMDRSKSERQVLILDCCYSGSFLHGSKAAALNESVFVDKAFKGNGYGRVILTATGKTQLAWEGQKMMGQVQKSVFTEHLVKGLRSGEADQDWDGWIGLDELYSYVHDHMIKASGPQEQTPEMNVFNMRGKIILARNPKPKPVELPRELQSLIVHPYADARLTAVGKLAQLFDSSPYEVALAARKALEKLATDDSRMVSEAAGRALGMIPSGKSAPPEVSEPPRVSNPSAAIAAAPPVPPATNHPQQGIPVSPGAAWWTQIKPLPGTRSGGGSKSGPALVEEPAPQPISTPSTSQASIPTQPAPTSSPNPVNPAFQNPPARKTTRLPEPDTLALIAGVLSLVLFFLPVSIFGLIASIRALRIKPISARAVAGLVLTGCAIMIQLTIILMYLVPV